MIKLHVIEHGKFKLDGGAMFGVVPKVMWQKLNEPDELNMCTWSMRSLLVIDGDRKILIDTGIGNKQSEKFRSHFSPHASINIETHLASLSLTREDITDVLLTHLHFDHVGGSLYLDKNGKTQLSYPNATYWTNELHYKWAVDPNERERASFLKENILPLREMGVLKMMDVQQEIAFSDNIKLLFVNGHTESMMLPLINYGKKKILYAADLIPSSGHLGLPYVMAYDTRPLLSIQEKREALERLLQDDHIVFFEHDRSIECGKVGLNDRGKHILTSKGNLHNLL